MQSSKNKAKSMQAISEYGSSKILNGATILIFNFDTKLASILLMAKTRKIDFNVYVLKSDIDSKTAKQLIKKKINLKIYSDLSLRQVLKVCDMVLIGADYIANDAKVYSKMGAELIAELAKHYDIPAYACMSLANMHIMKQKYDKIRAKKSTQYAFERIDPGLITGTITEIGIYKPFFLISLIKKYR